VPDEVIGALLPSLHRFCAPGSVLALSYVSKIEGASSEPLDEIQATYKRTANAQAYLRTIEHTARLAAPWRVRISQSLQEWVGLPDFLTEDEVRGGGFTMSGAILEV
jgi:hypothetical protein